MSLSLRPLCVALLLLVAGSSLRGQAPKLTSVLEMSEFAEDWKISRQFTLDVANAMPADSYSFKPSPEEMTFGEQMIHIAVGNAFRFNQITRVAAPYPRSRRSSSSALGTSLPGRAAPTRTAAP